MFDWCSRFCRHACTRYYLNTDRVHDCRVKNFFLELVLLKPDGLILYYTDTCFSNNFLKVECFTKALARRLHSLCLEFHKVYTICLGTPSLSETAHTKSMRATISRFDRLSFSNKVPIKNENLSDTRSHWKFLTKISFYLWI